MVSKIFVYTTNEIRFFNLDPKTGLMTQIGSLDYPSGGIVRNN